MTTTAPKLEYKCNKINENSQKEKEKNNLKEWTPMSGPRLYNILSA